jgi:hypothetical protein
MAMNSRLALLGVMGCALLAGSADAAISRTDNPAVEIKAKAAPPTPDTASRSTNAATPPSLSPAAAFAAVTTPENLNPYAPITERNVFHLNPPPPPPTNDPAPPPNIKITGFLKNDKELRALFAIPSKDPKEPTSYSNLAEGEQDGVLEVVKIFEDKEEVDVVNSGIRMTLSFKNNSFNPPKPVGGVPGQPAPPIPPTPTSTAVQPVSTAAAQSPNAGASVQPAAYTSKVVVAGGSTITPSGGAAVAQPGNVAPASGALHQIPTRTLRLTPQGSTGTQGPSADNSNLTTDEQLAKMVLDHAVADAKYPTGGKKPTVSTPAFPAGTHSPDFPPPLPDVEQILAGGIPDSGPPALPTVIKSGSRLTGGRR